MKNQERLTQQELMLLTKGLFIGNIFLCDADDDNIKNDEWVKDGGRKTSKTIKVQKRIT